MATKKTKVPFTVPEWIATLKAGRPCDATCDCKLCPFVSNCDALTNADIDWQTGDPNTWEAKYNKGIQKLAVKKQVTPAQIKKFWKAAEITETIDLITGKQTDLTFSCNEHGLSFWNCDECPYQKDCENDCDTAAKLMLKRFREYDVVRKAEEVFK
jgi:hypothetical protein